MQIKRGYDVMVNHPALTEWAIPTMGRIAGEQNVGVVDKVCGAEDFAFYQKVVPGLFYRVGCTPPDARSATRHPATARASTWTRTASSSGVKLQCALALDWLSANP